MRKSTIMPPIRSPAELSRKFGQNPLWKPVLHEATPSASTSEPSSRKAKTFGRRVHSSRTRAAGRSRRLAAGSGGGSGCDCSRRVSCGAAPVPLFRDASDTANARLPIASTSPPPEVPSAPVELDDTLSEWHSRAALCDRNGEEDRGKPRLRDQSTVGAVISGKAASRAADRKSTRLNSSHANISYA